MKSAVRSALFFILVTGPCFSAELPKEGNFDYTACWTGTGSTLSFSKTNTAMSFEQVGTVQSNPPGGMFDKETVRCVGINATLEGKRSSHIVCEATDADGNKRLNSFSMSDGKITREFIAGTGKYEGMVTTGTVQPLGPFPMIKDGTFTDCNRQTGTYKLK